MDKNEVNIAFEILLEEIEGIINGLYREGEQACKEQDYQKVRRIIENEMQVTAFREKIRELQREWENISIDSISVETIRKREYKKLKRGLRTSEDAFRIPILESLVELGGRAEMKDVLEKVRDKMKDKLNRYDLEGLPSNPTQKRWENTAQWCRNTLVKEGLLSSDSPRGIWEITPKGRLYLKEFKRSY